MKLFAGPAGSQHRLFYLVMAVALIAFSPLMIVRRANADQIYWANQNSIAYSQLDDTGGGYLPASVGAIHEGNGTAIDTANGRIYVSQEATNQIVWFGLDGVGAGVVNTASGTVNHPTNLSIDPATQTLYWANAVSPGSIGYAYVNESGGGLLVQPGSTNAHVQWPTRIAIDLRHDRVYWWNESSEEFSWVTTNGQIGGNLATPGLGFNAPGYMGGIAIEPYSTPEELYYVDNETEGIFHTDPLLGGEPEELQNAYNSEKNAYGPTGLAFDVIHNRFYWANSAMDENPEDAIGTATVFGNPATIKVFPEAPIHSPVFAAILKEPVVLEAPELSVSGTTLSCTQGEWEGDHPGASVYASPTSYSYQWRKGSTLIEGTAGNSFTPTETGSYSCVVVAENAAGDTTKATHATTVTFPAQPKPTTPSKPKTGTSKPKTKPGATAVSAKLVSAKPVKVKAGGTATIRVDLVNSGGTASGSTRVCGKLSKQAKKGLKPPVCVTVKSVAAGKTVVAKLKVKALATAHGTYKLTVAVGGATPASLAAKVQVARSSRR